MDRTAALDFAEKNWDRPCTDDDQIMVRGGVGFKQVSAERKRLDAPVSGGWEARFVYNGRTDDQRGDEAVFIKALPAADPGGVTIPDLPGRWLKKTIQEWAGLNDCAHYLSRCLINGKAGVPEVEKVGPLIENLIKLPPTKAKTLVEKVPKSAGHASSTPVFFSPGT